MVLRVCAIKGVDCMWEKQVLVRDIEIQKENWG